MTRIISICLLALFAPVLQGQTPQADAPSSCKVLYSMIEEDTLHNVNQGLLASGFSEKDGLKWLKKMYKKYPDVCYVTPNTKESIVFVIIATPAEYHGALIENKSHNVTDSNGQAERDDSGNTIQTTSSVAVPYQVNYSSFTLTVERKLAEGHFESLRRFRVEGLYHWAYGLSWGKGKHPVENVMEDAIKWIHQGGLNNPAQFVAQ